MITPSLLYEVNSSVRLSEGYPDGHEARERSSDEGLTMSIATTMKFLMLRALMLSRKPAKDVTDGNNSGMGAGRVQTNQSQLSVLQSPDAWSAEAKKPARVLKQHWEDLLE